MTEMVNGERGAALSYAQRVAALKQEQGEFLKVDDVAILVASLLQGAGNKLPAIGEVLHHEVFELRDYIQESCREIVEMGAQTISRKSIPGAASELGAVVEATQEAANKILDAADEIQALADGLAHQATSARMSDIATKIYEASSFQDITGQRIAKVVATLQHIDEKISRLATMFGDRDAPCETSLAVDAEGVALNPADLLNGPQMAHEATAQEDIDALLASFD